MRNIILIGVLLVCMLCSTGCSVQKVFYLSENEVHEKIITVLEEKYPEQEFQIVEKDGLYYIVEDENGIQFWIEPLETTQKQFWCRDNYLECCYEEAGIMEEANAVLEEYGIGGKIVKGENVQLDLGYLDVEDNREKMAEGLYELSRLIQPPVEVSYFEKGTPQAGETYEGSDSQGTFYVLCFEYTFHKPHVVENADDYRLFIKDIVTMDSIEDYQKVLDAYYYGAEGCNILAKAMDEDLYQSILDCKEDGLHPAEELGDSFQHFYTSLQLIYSKYDHRSDYPMESARWLDEEEYILEMIDTSGNAVVLDLGRNEKYEYNYYFEADVE